MAAQALNATLLAQRLRSEALTVMCIGKYGIACDDANAIAALLEARTHAEIALADMFAQNAAVRLRAARLEHVDDAEMELFLAREKRMAHLAEHVIAPVAFLEDTLTGMVNGSLDVAIVDPAAAPQARASRRGAKASKSKRTLEEHMRAHEEKFWRDFHLVFHTTSGIQIHSDFCMSGAEPTTRNIFRDIDTQYEPDYHVVVDGEEMDRLADEYLEKLREREAAEAKAKAAAPAQAPRPAQPARPTFVVPATEPPAPPKPARVQTKPVRVQTKPVRVENLSFADMGRRGVATHMDNMDNTDNMFCTSTDSTDDARATRAASHPGTGTADEFENCGGGMDAAASSHALAGSNGESSGQALRGNEEMGHTRRLAAFFSEILKSFGTMADVFDAVKKARAKAELYTRSDTERFTKTMLDELFVLADIDEEVARSIDQGIQSLANMDAAEVDEFLSATDQNKAYQFVVLVYALRVRLESGKNPWHRKLFTYFVDDVYHVVINAAITRAQHDAEFNIGFNKDLLIADAKAHNRMLKVGELRSFTRDVVGFCALMGTCTCTALIISHRGYDNLGGVLAYGAEMLVPEELCRMLYSVAAMMGVSARSTAGALNFLAIVPEMLAKVLYATTQKLGTSEIARVAIPNVPMIGMANMTGAAAAAAMEKIKNITYTVPITDLFTDMLRYIAATTHVEYGLGVVTRGLLLILEGLGQVGSLAAAMASGELGGSRVMILIGQLVSSAFTANSLLRGTSEFANVCTKFVSTSVATLGAQLVSRTVLLRVVDFNPALGVFCTLLNSMWWIGKFFSSNKLAVDAIVSQIIAASNKQTKVIQAIQLASTTIAIDKSDSALQAFWMMTMACGVTCVVLKSFDKKTLKKYIGWVINAQTAVSLLSAPYILLEYFSNLALLEGIVNTAKYASMVHGVATMMTTLGVTSVLTGVAVRHVYKRVKLHYTKETLASAGANADADSEKGKVAVNHVVNATLDKVRNVARNNMDTAEFAAIIEHINDDTRNVVADEIRIRIRERKDAALTYSGHAIFLGVLFLMILHFKVFGDKKE